MKPAAVEPEPRPRSRYDLELITSKMRARSRNMLDAELEEYNYLLETRHALVALRKKIGERWPS